MIGGISFSATSTVTGLDADKPVNPRPGSQYLAVDTKKQYNCYVAGVWVDNSRVSSGDSTKMPVNPTVGDIYIRTDNYAIYYCYVTGVWGQISNVNNVEVVGVYNPNKLIASNDSNQSVAFSWSEVKIFYVPMTITKANIKATWEAGYDGQARTIRSVLKINDVTIGDERLTENNWTTYSDDLTVYAGDKIALWGRYTSSLNTGGNVRNFRIYTELKYRHLLKPVNDWIFDVDNV